MYQMRRGSFNKRGSVSRAPGGYGVITPRGHRRIYDKKSKRLVMEHDYVYKAYHGGIPKGYCVHHRDGNKLNNRPKNLMLMKNCVHSYKHKAMKLKNGKFVKK